MSMDTDERSKVKDLTPSHLRAITVIDQVFFTQGRIPSKEEISAKAEVSVETLERWFQDRQFINALGVRGIDLSLINDPEDITPQQAIAATFICNTEDRRSLSEKLELCGISMSQWQGWCAQPRFRQYLRGRVTMLNDVSTSMAMLKVDELVNDGDYKAVELQLRMSGQYRPSQDVNVNVQALIVNILEIIQKHVRDPDTLHAIADDLEIIEDKANG